MKVYPIDSFINKWILKYMMLFYLHWTKTVLKKTTTIHNIYSHDYLQQREKSTIDRSGPERAYLLGASFRYQSIVQYWYWPSLTDVTEFALESAAADAFAAGTLAVTVAVRHLALVVFEAAFFALPAGIALALAVDIFAPTAAQNRTNTWQLGNTIVCLINHSTIS